MNRMKIVLILLATAKCGKLKDIVNQLSGMVTTKLNAIAKAAEPGFIKITSPLKPQEILPPKPLFILPMEIKARRKPPKYAFVQSGRGFPNYLDFNQANKMNPTENYQQLSDLGFGNLQKDISYNQYGFGSHLMSFPPQYPFGYVPPSYNPLLNGFNSYIPSTPLEAPNAPLKGRKLRSFFERLQQPGLTSGVAPVIPKIILTDKKDKQVVPDKMKNSMETEQSKENLDLFLDIQKELQNVRSLTLKINQEITEVNNKITKRSNEIGSKLSILERLKEETKRLE